MSLADGWANPLMAEALGRSREALCEPTDLAAYAHRRELGFNVAANLQRWDGWVRNVLLQHELIPPLDAIEIGPGRSAWLKAAGAAYVKLEGPDVGFLGKQVAAVMSYASLREDRLPEVLCQIDGQWPFWSALLPVRVSAVPALQEVVTAVVQMAVFVEMRFKHLFACPRPLELSPQVQPVISTPGHGTYPMGHATQAFAVAHVLKWALADATGAPPSGTWVRQVDLLAHRIGENRIVAGVHFPVDLWGGVRLGVALGRLAMASLRGRPLQALPQGFLDALDVAEGDPTGLDPVSVGKVMEPINAELARYPAPDEAPPTLRAEYPAGLLPEAWFRAVDELRKALR